MVRTEDVKSQLSRIGVNFQFMCRAELRELPSILFDNEQIHHVVRGRYEGGWAIVCATNQRVLLIDKKPFYLTIEDMRYDMIADVEYNQRLVDSSIRLGTVNKTLRFRSFNHGSLRLITSFIQQQVMAFRQRQTPMPRVGQNQFTPQFSNDPITDKLIGQSAMNGIINDSPINPYISPVMIRRRVSRFY